MIAALALGLLVPHAAFSQESSPLGARRGEYPRIGIDAGISSITQQGIWRVGCGEFAEGSGIAPLFAVAYDAPIAPGLRYEGLFGFQQRSITSSQNIEGPTQIATESGVATAVIQFENRGRLSSSTIFLLPSVRYAILPWLYAGAGASAGLVLSTTAEYSQEILTRVVQNGSELTEVFYDPTESSDGVVRTFPEEKRDDAASLLLDGVFYLGADIDVATGWTAGPRVIYSLPLTPVFAEPALKLQSLQFMIGIRRELR